MKLPEKVIIVLFITILSNSCGKEIKQNKKEFGSDDMMIRIAEIEINADYLEEYISILEKESEASIRLEPGVISIFPMFQRKSD